MNSATGVPTTAIISAIARVLGDVAVLYFPVASAVAVDSAVAMLFLPKAFARSLAVAIVPTVFGVPAAAAVVLTTVDTPGIPAAARVFASAAVPTGVSNVSWSLPLLTSLLVPFCGQHPFVI